MVEKIKNNRFYLKVKKLRQEAKINEPAKLGDAGYDVFSMEDVILQPHDRYNMPLGIAIEIPLGWVCIVNQKSGIAKNFGIDTIGNVIDSNYRGEIHAQIVNTSNDIVNIEKNKKIAQLVFLQHGSSEIEYVNELSETERGETGFGSTGLN